MMQTRLMQFYEHYSLETIYMDVYIFRFTSISGTEMYEYIREEVYMLDIELYCSWTILGKAL